MPKTKFTPNQSDLQAIKLFLKSVSWGIECTLCTRLDGSRTYLLSDCIVWMPCSWQDFEREIDSCKALGKKLNVKPGFIFHDRAPDIDCDRIMWQAYREGVVNEWLDVYNRVQHSGFLVKAMDGIEWWDSTLWKQLNQ